jgi:hypothetical protein
MASQGIMVQRMFRWLGAGSGLGLSVCADVVFLAGWREQWRCSVGWAGGRKGDLEGTLVAVGCLAVVDHIDARADLGADHRADGLGQLPGVPFRPGRGEAWRPVKTAGVGGENAFGTQPHGIPRYIISSVNGSRTVLSSV